MKWFLVVYLCSQVQSVCVDPHVFPESYNDQYTCLVDGYKKSYEKLIDIGPEEVNKHGMYIKFDCSNFILPKPKPKGSPT